MSVLIDKNVTTGKKIQTSDGWSCDLDSGDKVRNFEELHITGIIFFSWEDYLTIFAERYEDALDSCAPFPQKASTTCVELHFSQDQSQKPKWREYGSLSRAYKYALNKKRREEKIDKEIESASRWLLHQLNVSMTIWTPAIWKGLTVRKKNWRKIDYILVQHSRRLS